MTLIQDEKDSIKVWTMNKKPATAQAIAILAALLHVLTLVSMVGVLFGCNTSSFTTQGYIMQNRGWKAINTSLNTCVSDVDCYWKSQPWIEDAKLSEDYWNPFVMIVLFESISASFAIYYLRDNRLVPSQLRNMAQPLSITAVVGGYAMVIVWFLVLGQRQGWAQLVIGFWATVLTIGIQFKFDDVRNGIQPAGYDTVPSTAPGGIEYKFVYNNGIPFKLPQGRLAGNGSHPSESSKILDSIDVLLRYAEYTLSAPILFVAVLTIFSVGPPSWIVFTGYIGVTLCNLFGLPLHLIQMDSIQDRELSFWKGTRGDEWMEKIDLLIASWLGVGLALLGIYYTGWGALFNTSLPPFVMVVLWSLIAGYCSFGLVGTVEYVFGVLGPSFSTVLDMLSVSCKVVISVTICLAFMQMPGGGCT